MTDLVDYLRARLELDTVATRRVCGVCHREFSLTKHGTLRAHWLPPSMRTPEPWGHLCPGNLSDGRP